jgi:hypothetical protein
MKDTAVACMKNVTLTRAGALSGTRGGDARIREEPFILGERSTGTHVALDALHLGEHGFDEFRSRHCRKVADSSEDFDYRSSATAPASGEGYRPTE